jgi:hypothetical protein
MSYVRQGLMFCTKPGLIYVRRSGKLLLVLASTVIVGSESHGHVTTFTTLRLCESTDRGLVRVCVRSSGKN